MLRVNDDDETLFMGQKAIELENFRFEISRKLLMYWEMPHKSIPERKIFMSEH